MNMFWIIVLLVVTIGYVGSRAYKRSLLKRLLVSLQKQEYDTFFKTIDGIGCKCYFSMFHRLYFKMNAYILLANKQKVEETFDDLLSLRLTKKQNLDVTMKAFYYYIDDENQAKCLALMERVTSLHEDAASQECQMMYDIFVCKKANYIQTMKEQLLEQDGIAKGMLQYMLAVQYDHLGERETKLAYVKEAYEVLKETPYRAKLEQLME